MPLMKAIAYTDTITKKAQGFEAQDSLPLPTNLAVTGGGRSAGVRLSSRRSLSRAASCPEPPNISYSQFHTQRSAGSGAEKLK